MTSFLFRPCLLLLGGLMCATLAQAQLRAAPGANLGAPTAQAPASVRGDFIVAVVNQTPVTNRDVQRRLERVAAQAQASGQRLPARAELLELVVQQLIDERVQLDHARETGQRVEATVVERAMQDIAARNGLTLAQLESEVRAQGMDMDLYRAGLRDELTLQRVREREVEGRIRITDVDIDAFLASQREQNADQAVYDLSQILVAVPEGASAQERDRLRARAQELRERAAKGEAFDALARAHSDAPDRADGGALGPRRGDRLPTLFVEAAIRLSVGELSPVLESGAGFHVLRLNDRVEGSQAVVPQTRVRHILLRADPGDSETQLLRRLSDYKRWIETGQSTFEQLAREHSEDGSAMAGGDLGWAVPGQFVPEFEDVMQRLSPGQLSEPFTSRFGAHLVQVLERREVPLTQAQRREVARNMLRAERFESTYEDWARELRDRAYVELREEPR